MTEKLTLTVKEVAAELNISRVTAYELCAREDFPSIRIGERRIVVPREEFIQWIRDTAANKVQTNGQQRANL